MDEAVRKENCEAALAAVTRNRGAAGIDRMRVDELEEHLRRHWPKIRARLLAGTYVPSPVRRVTIPKPNGGERELGIPTVQDRFVQQLLLQVMTPIYEPRFSEHSYGFRPGRSAQDAVNATRRYFCEGKQWVVDMDIAKFFDHVHHDILLGRIGKTIRDKRVLRLIGKYLRRGNQSRTSTELRDQWSRYVRGWWGYFRHAEERRAVFRLEGWIRRHIRKCFWLRWHNATGRLNALRRLGLRGRMLKVAYSSKGAWPIARSGSLHTALSNQVLRRYGFVMPSDLAEQP